jgi:anti-sigma factor RsiW
VKVVRYEGAKGSSKKAGIPMAVNDSDLELLHAYLDNELPVAECEGLWRRLTGERDLMMELDRLRADYTVRTMAWSSLEPSDHSLARLESRMMRAARRSDLIERVQGVVRLVTTVAALVLFGFTVGWLGRERYIVTPNMASVGQNTPIRMAASNIPQMPAGGKIAVLVDDGSGKPITVQFDSMDEANRFLHDFRSPQLAAPSGGTDSPIVPAMDKF